MRSTNIVRKLDDAEARELSPRFSSRPLTGLQIRSALALRKRLGLIMGFLKRRGAPSKPGSYPSAWPKGSGIGESAHGQDEGDWRDYIVYTTKRRLTGRHLRKCLPFLHGKGVLFTSTLNAITFHLGCEVCLLTGNCVNRVERGVEHQGNPYSCSDGDLWGRTAGAFPICHPQKEITGCYAQSNLSAGDGGFDPIH